MYYDPERVQQLYVQTTLDVAVPMNQMVLYSIGEIHLLKLPNATDSDHTDMHNDTRTDCISLGCTHAPCPHVSSRIYGNACEHLESFLWLCTPSDAIAVSFGYKMLCPGYTKSILAH